MKRLKILTGQESVLLWATDEAVAADTTKILNDVGVNIVPCATAQEFCELMGQCHVAIVTQEDLLSDADQQLHTALGGEAAWSDFPIIIIVSEDEEVRDVIEAMEVIGNMTLVERPIRTNELVRAVKAGLRDRKRQYAIRDQLAELETQTDQLRASENRYDLAVSGMNDGLWDYDIESGTMFFSARYKTMLGYTEEEFPNSIEFARELVHPEDKEKALQLLDDYLTGKVKVYENEFRMLHKEGRYRWILSRGAATYNDDGKPVRITGLHTDITKQKKLEKKLRRSQEIFRTMADSVPALVWMAALDRSCFYFNKAWLDYTGRTLEEQIGEGWTESVHPDDLAHCLEMRASTFAERKSFEMIYRLRRYDGEYRSIIDRGEPHYDIDGNFAGYTGACIDIHDKLEIEELLRASEVRFRQMVDSIPQLSWVTDQFGELFWFNKRWLDYADDSSGNMQQLGWQSVVHPDYAKGVIRRFQQSMVSGDPWEDTFPIRGKNGEYRWFLSRAYPIDDGKVIRWFGTHTDITQQMERETKAQISEERWRVLTEAMPQLVWIDRGSDGKTVYLSRQWEEYTGLTVEQLLDYDWQPCFHPDDEEPTVIAWNKAVSEKSVYDVEFRIRRHDGVYRWFKTRGVPSFDESGEVDMWYGTCTDIQDLVDARERAGDANRAKTDFLANMSHEIRTPMNAVIGLSSILAMTKPLTERQAECIKTLRLSADSLLSLINNLLDIEKIEARTIELEEIPFSIVELMNDVISVMSVNAAERGIAFDTTNQCEGLEDRTYLGDPTRIRQILMNLCSNAIKFTEKGGVHLTIDCFASVKPGHETISIAVRDTGIGIDAAKRDTIFQKFVQGDSSINRKFGGTGLGLAITKTLAEIMSGTIKVESEMGQGSTFTVSLPLRLAKKQEMPEAAEAPVERAASIADRVRPHVLLVEDYPANVLVATTFLEQFGYECDVASNGIEAIDKVKKNAYVVVLMDVQMSEMNGLDATRHIRLYEQEKGLPRIPIIGMTAHALAGDCERCLEAGMDDYITKPFNPDELERKLEAALETAPS